MELFHHSQDVMEQVNPCSYIQSIHIKPNGLWLSCETKIKEDISWQEWCEIHQYRLDRLKYKHKVKLKPNIKLITIHDEKSLIQFSEQYRTKNHHRTKNHPVLKINLHMDWITIAKSHQGIMIYPTQHALRFDSKLSWYHSWDCASGCIWDTNAIESIELIEEITCQNTENPKPA